jgi:hypothetical protein
VSRSRVSELGFTTAIVAERVGEQQGQQLVCLGAVTGPLWCMRLHACAAQSLVTLCRHAAGTHRLHCLTAVLPGCDDAKPSQV